MTRSLLIIVLKLAVIAAAIGYLIFFQRVDFSQLRISQGGWPWLASAAGLIIAQMVLLQFRLFVFLRTAGVAISFDRVLGAGLISWFINSTMLGGLGALSTDAVRAGYLVRETRKRTSLFSIMFFDRLMGLVGLLSLACAVLGAGLLAGSFNEQISALSVEAAYALWCIVCALAAVAAHQRTGSGIAITLGSGVALLSGLTLYFVMDHPVGLPWMMLAVALAALGALAILRFRAATDLSSSVLRSLQGIVSEAVTTFLALRGKATAVLAGYALSLISQVMVITAIYLLGRAIRIEPQPTLFQTFIAAPVAFLTGVLPLPANGIGVGEVAFDAMLALQQPAGAVPLAGATLYLAFRILTALTAVVGAPFFLIGRARKAVDCVSDDEPR